MILLPCRNWELCYQAHEQSLLIGLVEMDVI